MGADSFQRAVASVVTFIVLLGVSFVLSAAVAFVAARKFGVDSRRKKRAIFSTAGFARLLP
jgi:hypothetical protein